MNEEEKEAIENLKKNRGVSFKEADILSNIIEKQQIEIKKLKDDLREERDLNVEALKTLKECVHKDRIKGIINLYKHRKDEITQLFFSMYGKTQDTYTQAVFTEVIKVLEELLGE